MFERLQEWSVFKTRTYENIKTDYIIIIKNRLLPGVNKTAKLCKNWDDDSSPLSVDRIIQYDFRNYSNYIKNEVFECLNNEETNLLENSINSLPDERIRKKICGKKDSIKLINKIKIPLDDFLDPSCSSEVQRISKINSGGLECLSKELPNNINYERNPSIN